MPCPFFIPSSTLGEVNPGATPLGDLFGGSCAADPDYTIPLELLRRGCNFGYARPICPLAALSDADSTCFLIAGSCSDTIQIRWSVERDHHPVAVGEMQISPDWSGAADPLQEQARAYASVYRRRAK